MYLPRVRDVLTGNGKENKLKGMLVFGLIVGLFLGGVFGIVISAFMHAAGTEKADDDGTEGYR